MKSFRPVCQNGRFRKATESMGIASRLRRHREHGHCGAVSRSGGCVGDTMSEFQEASFLGAPKGALGSSSAADSPNTAPNLERRVHGL